MNLKIINKNLFSDFVQKIDFSILEIIEKLEQKEISFDYYKNLKKVEIEYIDLDYNKSLDFLLMTVNSLKA